MTVLNPRREMVNQHTRNILMTLKSKGKENTAAYWLIMRAMKSCMIHNLKLIKRAQTVKWHEVLAHGMLGIEGKRST